jgi:hypothetical protein
VMQNFLYSKSLYDIFSDLHGKDSKTLIWHGQKQHLRNKEKKKFNTTKLRPGVLLMVCIFYSQIRVLLSFPWRSENIS